MFLFLILCVTARTVSGDVLELTDESFINLKENDFALVMFYAPWCGHCKALKPEFEEAATQLVTKKPKIVLGKIDCTTNLKVCGDYEIRGYPTLKVFRNGEFSSDYNGGRKTDSIVSFVMSNSGPASIEFSSKNELEELIQTTRPLVIAQFKKNSLVVSEFLKCADELREHVSFAHTHKKILHNDEEQVIQLRPNKAYLSKLEDAIHVYNGDLTQNEIKQWINDNAFGLVGIKDETNVNFFSERPMLVFYTKIDMNRDPSGYRYWHNRLVKFVKGNLFGMKFALSDTTSSMSELDRIGLEVTENKTQFVVILNEKGQNFVLQEEISIPSIQKFLIDYEAGSLEPYLKSQPIPTDSDSHVRAVVALNFDEIVFDPTKDVLIEFYAPWCGHCKKLKPVYEELAAKLVNEPNVVIAAMDATANTVSPMFSVEGFPTIYWLPRDSKSVPVPYNGGRSLDDLLKYIAKHATQELSGFDRSGTAKKAEL